MPWLQRRSKYNARRTEYDGRKYDSKLEAGLAHELDMRRRIGEIREIKPQHTFELRVNGHLVCRHRVDFLVTMPDGSLKVYEAKGWATEDWRIKRELFLATHPEIPYEVVTAKGTWRKRR
jgi:hypothetical protein